jgi:hypothetical protein
MSETRIYYIPRVEIETTEKYIEGKFNWSCFGTPSRIDFVFLKNNKKWKSVFVHCLTGISDWNKELIDSIQSGKPYKWYYENSEKYWILLSPKPKTITREKIAKLEEQVQNLRHVIYQLVSGLYCPITQTKTLNTYIDLLYPEFQSIEDIPLRDTSRWRSRPTTQQSDDCERRIAALEERVNTLSINYINNDTNYDETYENESVSTHSSMPSLVSASSSDDNGELESDPTRMPTIISEDESDDSNSHSTLTWLEDVDSIHETDSL